MTMTDTDLAASVHPSASARPRDVVIPPALTGKRPGLSRAWLLTPVVAIVAGVGAWQAWLFVTARALPADIRLYDVKRMDVPIILREKGQLTATNNVIIRNEMKSGRRESSNITFLIPEGTQVEKGDLLVELAADAVEDEIRGVEVVVATAQSEADAAEAEVEIQIQANAAIIALATTTLKLAEIDLRKWEDGDRYEQELDATVLLKSAELRLGQAVERLRIGTEMHAQGFATTVELEEDKIAYEEAVGARDKAKKAIEVLRVYTFEKDKETFKSALLDAKGALERAIATAKVEEKKGRAALANARLKLKMQQDVLAEERAQLAKAKIRAPQAGLVVYHTERYRSSSGPIAVGARIYQNQRILSLPDLSEMQVVIRVHEADAERIKPGLPAKIKVAGVFERIAGDTETELRTTGAPKVFSGRVSKVAAVADSRSSWMNPDLREFETVITLDESDPRLKPGMTAEVEVFVDHLEDVLAVPVQAIYSRARKSYVFVGGNGGAPAAYREVQLGASSTQFVEVLEGISAGERVWLAISDDMLTLLPAVKKLSFAAPEPSSPRPSAGAPAGS